ncbi:MAG: type IV secretion system protein [Solirubrobacterales bacterium]
MSSRARQWRRPVLIGLGLSVLIVASAHPFASAATDVWDNVAPASPLGANGLVGRYPLSHYALDQHFDAVSASLTGGVNVSGVPPMIAYFLASILWLLTSFLADLLITLFSFAFSLDLVNGSQATGEAGALGPVAQAIHSTYANVFGAPWLVLAVTVAGLWAMWRSLVLRRHSETAGALALSLVYVVIAFFFVAQPGASVGAASKLTNQMSEAFLAISDHGSPSGGGRARDDAANQLFNLLVFKPWVVLEYGGLEHCAVDGTGSSASDPESAPVRPLSQNPSRDAALARRLANGTEVAADGKTCVNNANKYAAHFLRFAVGSDERGAEYDALNDGDSSELSDADQAKAGYQLEVADKPATDAMEEGGQFQRLGLVLVLFVGELGAILLLGSLAVGIVLAQVLLLLLLAFAPVALVAAAIPGRGHAFFTGWLEKLAGYLLRKAAYSLILATLLAVSGALASATTQLGWLMSFGLQSLFFWAVFIQRRSLTESLIGIATGPAAPGREATVRLLALYAGARVGGRASRPLRRGARSAIRAPGRLLGGTAGSRGGGRPGDTLARPAAPSGGASSTGAPVPTERPQGSEKATGAQRVDRPRQAQASSRPTAASSVTAKGGRRSTDKAPAKADRKGKGETAVEKPAAERTAKQPPPRSAAPVRKQVPQRRAESLGEELRAERERVAKKGADKKPTEAPSGSREETSDPQRFRRSKGGSR